MSEAPCTLFWPRSGVQPAARPPDVAGDPAHRDQAAGVVGAGGVLGDPHAPEDHARASLAPGPRDLPDHRGVDAGDLRGPFRRVVLDGVGEGLVIAGAVRDELAVGQPEPDHLVHDAVVERDVGARLELAEDVGVVGHLVGPRVDVDDRRAPPAGLLEERGRDRVIRGGVTAGHDRHVGVQHVGTQDEVARTRHRAGSVSHAPVGGEPHAAPPAGPQEGQRQRGQAAAGRQPVRPAHVRADRGRQRRPGRWPPRPPWTRRSGLPRATRRPRRARSANCSPSARRRPASRPWCSTAAATCTTAASRPWRTAPGKAACNCEQGNNDEHCDCAAC